MSAISIARGVADLLVTHTVGLEMWVPTVVVDPADPTTWAIKIGRMWDVPDRQIVCFDTGGTDSYPNLAIDWWNVEVIVRGDKEGYTMAWTKISEVKDVCLGIAPFVFSDSTRVNSIILKGNINFMGYDDKLRPMFSLNLLLICEEVPGSKSHRVPV